jgi:hypothetical protein
MKKDVERKAGKKRLAEGLETRMSKTQFKVAKEIISEFGKSDGIRPQLASALRKASSKSETAEQRIHDQLVKMKEAKSTWRIEGVTWALVEEYMKTHEAILSKQGKFDLKVRFKEHNKPKAKPRHVVGSSFQRRAAVVEESDDNEDVVIRVRSRQEIVTGLVSDGISPNPGPARPVFGPENSTEGMWTKPPMYPFERARECWKWVRVDAKWIQVRVLGSGNATRRSAQEVKLMLQRGGIEPNPGPDKKHKGGGLNTRAKTAARDAESKLNSAIWGVVMDVLQHCGLNPDDRSKAKLKQAALLTGLTSPYQAVKEGIRTNPRKLATEALGKDYALVKSVFKLIEDGELNPRTVFINDQVRRSFTFVNEAPSVVASALNIINSPVSTPDEVSTATQVFVNQPSVKKTSLPPSATELDWFENISSLSDEEEEVPLVKLGQVLDDIGVEEKPPQGAATNMSLSSPIPDQGTGREDSKIVLPPSQAAHSTGQQTTTSPPFPNNGGASSSTEDGLPPVWTARPAEVNGGLTAVVIDKQGGVDLPVSQIHVAPVAVHGEAPKGEERKTVAQGPVVPEGKPAYSSVSDDVGGDPYKCTEVRFNWPESIDPLSHITSSDVPPSDAPPASSCMFKVPQGLPRINLPGTQVKDFEMVGMRRTVEVSVTRRRTEPTVINYAGERHIIDPRPLHLQNSRITMYETYIQDVTIRSVHPFPWWYFYLVCLVPWCFSNIFPPQTYKFMPVVMNAWTALSLSVLSAVGVTMLILFRVLERVRSRTLGIVGPYLDALLSRMPETHDQCMQLVRQCASLSLPPSQYTSLMIHTSELFLKLRKWQVKFRRVHEDFYSWLLTDLKIANLELATRGRLWATNPVVSTHSARELVSSRKFRFLVAVTVTFALLFLMSLSISPIALSSSSHYQSGLSNLTHPSVSTGLTSEHSSQDSSNGLGVSMNYPTPISSSNSTNSSGGTWETTSNHSDQQISCRLKNGLTQQATTEPGKTLSGESGTGSTASAPHQRRLPESSHSSRQSLTPLSSTPGGSTQEQTRSRSTRAAFSSPLNKLSIPPSRNSLSTHPLLTDLLSLMPFAVLVVFTWRLIIRRLRVASLRRLWKPVSASFTALCCVPGQVMRRVYAPSYREKTTGTHAVV